jgi:ribosomal protein S18 acetylase RimI-like enzyme
MIDDVSIVPLRAADVPLLAALARDIWRAHYPGIISGAQIEYMLAERYDEAVIRAELEAENVWWDVLKRDGRMAAYVSYGLTDVAGEMKIDKLYVQAQRRGDGGRLINHVAAVAARRGCKRLTLAVNRHNQSAIAAYHKHGFHIARTSVRDIGGGFVMDDYIMVREMV